MRTVIAIVAAVVSWMIVGFGGSLLLTYLVINPYLDGDLALCFINGMFWGFVALISAYFVYQAIDD